MSDIHGMGELWDLVKEELAQEETTLIFLGDACDRGPDGYNIMKEMLSMPNVIYLQGNHEDFFVRSCLEIKDAASDMGVTVCEYAKSFDSIEDLMLCSGWDNQLHEQNGGASTIKGWIADGAPMDIVSKISKLPVQYQMNQYDFCHAGCLQEEWGAKSSMLWSRDHFNEEWFEGRTLIHGHTPVKYVYYEVEEEFPRLWKPMRYQPNKIDMDTCAFKTDTICLLNLETNDIIVFTPEEELPTF